MALFNKIKVGSEEYDTWSTYDLVEDIREEIINHVENPATVTAVASEIASGKQAIAAAINAKGGTASATESFSELAQDIQDTPTSGVLSNGIVQTEPFSFLDYVCKQGAYPFTEIDDSSVTAIDRPNAFYQQTRLSKVKMSALTTISGGYVFQSCSALQEVDMPSLTTISGNHIFLGCTSLVHISLPNLTTISGGYVFQDDTSLETINFPSVTTIYGASIILYCSSLKSMLFGTLVNVPNNFMNYDSKTLRNITIGQDTNINLPFNYWTATNVIAEGQSGIDELNSNLYNNLLTKLYDHSQDGETRTLRLGWLANVTQENIDYATSKGWTLTT